jgi:hypothetical protein
VKKRKAEEDMKTKRRRIEILDELSRRIARERLGRGATTPE